jgi:hypothetical protein
MRKFPVLGSALVLALSGAFIAAPAMAFTHHPSTPQERQQTKELNEQSLKQAEGQAPANQQAMNAQQAAPQAQQQAAPQGQAQPQATPGQGDPNQTAPVTAPSGTAPPANADDSTAGQPPAPQQQ